jgi:Domain of Unknown Function with PDB structure (DUF3857)/Transglutaminase-like superfamily
MGKNFSFEKQRVRLVCYVFLAVLSFTGLLGEQSVGLISEAHAAEFMRAGYSVDRDSPRWIYIHDGSSDRKLSEPIYISRLEQQINFNGVRSHDRFVWLVIGGKDVQVMRTQAQQSIPFNPAFQTLVMHRLAVLRGGASIDLTDKLTPQLLPSDTAKNSVYGGFTNAVFEFPDIRHGDQIEMVFTIKGANPVVAGTPWAWEAWGQGLPVQQRRLTMMWPSHMPMQTAIFPHDHPDRALPLAGKLDPTAPAGWTRMVWDGADLPVTPIEENEALGSLQRDIVVATAYANWAEVQRWGANLFESTPAPTAPEFNDIADKFANLDTPAKRAAAALRWVQFEFRYVSMSMGLNSHRPYPPDEVIKRRYGDCKDKTWLLINLLRRLGVEAHPALMTLGTNPGWARRMLPSPALFDHAVAVAWVDGKPVVLDATIGEQPSDLFRMATWHAGKDLLILSGPHAGWLTAPAHTDLQQVSLEIEERMAVQPGGREGILGITQTLNGTRAEERRWQLASMSTEQAMEMFIKDLRQLYPSAQWRGRPQVEDDPKLNRMRLSGEFLVKDPLKRVPGGRWRHEYSDRPILELLPAVNAEGRSVAMGLGENTRRVRLTHALQLPEGWKIDEAAFDEKVDARAFRMRVQRQLPNPFTVVDTHELELLATQVRAKEIGDYIKASRQVHDFQTEMKVIP